MQNHGGSSQGSDANFTGVGAIMMSRRRRKIERMLRQGIGGFDAVYYLQQNPDVAGAGVDPLRHYLVHGWREGRNPCAYFDSADYLAANPDVAKAGVNPLIHFLEFGLIEGRFLGQLKTQNRALSRLERRRTNQLKAARAQYASVLGASRALKAENDELKRREAQRKQQAECLQAYSAAAIAASDGARSRSEHLSRCLNEALARVSEFQSRSDMEKHFGRLVDEFENYVRTTAMPDLPVRPGRTCTLRSLPEIDLLRAFSLINIVHKALRVPGQIAIFTFEDEGIARLLAEEVESRSRQFYLIQLTDRGNPTEKDGEISGTKPTVHPVDMALVSSTSSMSNASVSRNFVHLVRGTLNEVLGSAQLPERVAFALVSLGLYQPTKAVLQCLDEIIPMGGYVAISEKDTLSQGCERAIVEFLDSRAQNWTNVAGATNVVGLMILHKVS
jgi:hypothetical protein